MRLVDADALIEKYAGWVNIYSPKPGGKESLRVVTTQEIGYMPTIDAIPMEWLEDRVYGNLNSSLYNFQKRLIIRRFCYCFNLCFLPNPSL